MAARQGSINLLPQEFREPGRLQALRVLLTKTSMALLVVYLAALVGTVLLLFIFSRQLQGYTLQNQTLAEGIDGLRTREGILLSLQNRTRLVRSIFAETRAAELLAEKLFASLPPDMELEDASSDGATLTVSLRAANSLAFSELIKNLGEGGFTRVTLTAFNQTALGDYLISLEVN